MTCLSRKSKAIVRFLIYISLFSNTQSRNLLDEIYRAHFALRSSSYLEKMSKRRTIVLESKKQVRSAGSMLLKRNSNNLTHLLYVQMLSLLSEVILNKPSAHSYPKFQIKPLGLFSIASSRYSRLFPSGMNTLNYGATLLIYLVKIPISISEHLQNYLLVLKPI